jgi:hypothetical protein
VALHKYKGLHKKYELAYKIFLSLYLSHTKTSIHINVVFRYTIFPHSWEALSQTLKIPSRLGSFISNLEDERVAQQCAFFFLCLNMHTIDWINALKIIFSNELIHSTLLKTLIRVMRVQVRLNQNTRNHEIKNIIYMDVKSI